MAQIKTNHFVQWIFTQCPNQSMREISRKIGMSHAYVTNVLQGNVPITWNFAAVAAERMGLDTVEAFKMAGLLKDKAGVGGDAQAGLTEATGDIIPQVEIVVTKGEVQNAPF